MSWIQNSILNQKGSPAIFTDDLANRPAAGYTGRLFVAKDTFAWYRDNGTTWDLIGGPGSGTITGSLTANRVAYATGANTIATSANLLFNGTTLTAQAFTSNTDVTINGVKFGAGGGNKNTNVAAGSGALSNANNAAPGYTVAIGYNALLAATSPDYALAIGARSMENTQTSSANGSVAIGPLSLFQNLTGVWNTVIGYGSMTNNTSGSSNVSIGYLSQDNSATGNNNTSIGAMSLANVSTGSNNVAIGVGAGSSTASGGSNFNSNECTYVGGSTRSFNPGGHTNEIVIGHSAVGAGSNTVTLGNTGITNTYLKGIVNSTGQIITKTGSGISLEINDSGNGNALDIDKSGSGFAINVAAGVSNFGNSVYLAVNSGSVGIATNNPQARLDVNGDVCVTSGNYYSFASNNVNFSKMYRSGGIRFENNTFLTTYTDAGNWIINTTTDDGINKLQVNGGLKATAGQFNTIAIEGGNNLTWGGTYGANIPTIVGVSGAGSFLAFYPSGSANGEAARFSNSNRFLIGVTVDNGVDILQANGSINITSSIKTGAPSGGTAAAWKLGSIVTGGAVLDVNSYIELEVNGVTKKLLVST